MYTFIVLQEAKMNYAKKIVSTRKLRELEQKSSRDEVLEMVRNDSKIQYFEHFIRRVLSQVQS